MIRVCRERYLSSKELSRVPLLSRRLKMGARMFALVTRRDMASRGEGVKARCVGGVREGRRKAEVKGKVLRRARRERRRRRGREEEREEAEGALLLVLLTLFTAGGDMVAMAVVVVSIVMGMTSRLRMQGAVRVRVIVAVVLMLTQGTRALG
jgi:hypothetical protein